MIRRAASSSRKLLASQARSASKQRGLRIMPIRSRARTRSWVLPGVVRKAKGRPISSVSAWILVVCPPRKRPIALLKAPFCASCGAMGFDVGRVHRDRSVHTGRAGQGVKDARPNPLPAAAVEAIIDRRVGAIDFRAIAPVRTRFQHVHDATDEAAIIDPMRPFAPRGNNGSIRRHSASLSQ